MGVCKCRKRTNLFCFVHSKAVCENCVAEDHDSCYVSSYIDWLTNSTYDAPLCPVCHHDVGEDVAFFSLPPRLTRPALQLMATRCAWSACTCSTRIVWARRWPRSPLSRRPKRFVLSGRVVAGERC